MFQHKPRYETRYYGWQTLLADGGSAVIIIVGTVATNGDSVAPLVAGLTTFALGSPAIHLAHRNVTGGLESLGLRVGAPLVLGFATYSGCADSSDSLCGLLGGWGAFVGMVGASAFDAAVLAHRRVEVEPDVALIPTLGRDRAGLTMVGAF